MLSQRRISGQVLASPRRGLGSRARADRPAPKSAPYNPCVTHVAHRWESAATTVRTRVAVIAGPAQSCLDPILVHVLSKDCREPLVPEGVLLLSQPTEVDSLTLARIRPTRRRYIVWGAPTLLDTTLSSTLRRGNDEGDDRSRWSNDGKSLLMCPTTGCGSCQASPRSPWRYAMPCSQAPIGFRTTGRATGRPVRWSSPVRRRCSPQRQPFRHASPPLSRNIGSPGGRTGNLPKRSPWGPSETWSSPPSSRFLRGHGLVAGRAQPIGCEFPRVRARLERDRQAPSPLWGSPDPGGSAGSAGQDRAS
jgi:hypothetical protein